MIGYLIVISMILIGLGYAGSSLLGQIGLHLWMIGGNLVRAFSGNELAALFALALPAAFIWAWLSHLVKPKTSRGFPGGIAAWRETAVSAGQIGPAYSGERSKTELRDLGRSLLALQGFAEVATPDPMSPDLMILLGQRADRTVILIVEDRFPDEPESLFLKLIESRKRSKVDEAWLLTCSNVPEPASSLAELMAIRIFNRSSLTDQAHGLLGRPTLSNGSGIEDLPAQTLVAELPPPPPPGEGS